MVFFKNMLSQLVQIKNIQSTLVVKYIISPMAENLPTLIVHYTLKFKKG